MNETLMEVSVEPQSEPDEITLPVEAIAQIEDSERGVVVVDGEDEDVNVVDVSDSGIEDPSCANGGGAVEDETVDTSVEPNAVVEPTVKSETIASDEFAPNLLNDIDAQPTEQVCGVIFIFIFFFKWNASSTWVCMSFMIYWLLIITYIYIYMFWTNNSESYPSYRTKFVLK